LFKKEEATGRGYRFKTILWRTDLFLGNNHKTNKKTIAVDRQQILNKQQLNNNRGTVENGVFYLIGAKGLYNKDTSLATVWRRG
jgi:hypothetical protein